MLTVSSTASIDPLSISSSIAGRSAAVIATTASAAASTVANVATGMFTAGSKE